MGTSAGLRATSWLWVSMGLGAGGAGRAGRRAHYDYDRATARRGRLPESLGCTTDYRHETGAPRRTPPRSGRPPRPPPAPPPHRFIHSVHNYSYGRHDGREAAREAPPRERAARARAPPPGREAPAPPPSAREHAHRAPTRLTTPALRNFQTLLKQILIIKSSSVLQT